MDSACVGYNKHFFLCFVGWIFLVYLMINVAVNWREKWKYTCLWGYFSVCQFALEPFFEMFCKKAWDFLTSMWKWGNLLKFSDNSQIPHLTVLNSVTILSVYKCSTTKRQISKFFIHSNYSYHFFANNTSRNNKKVSYQHKCLNFRIHFT